MTDQQDTRESWEQLCPELPPKWRLAGDASVRLDLNDIYCATAKKLGISIVISTDAHSMDGLDDMRFGVDQARRGWLGPDDVLNTRSLDDFAEWLARRRE